MNNKGQTTVFFTLMISVLLIFTLVALEVGRIYMSRVKIKSCVHSMHSSIMADYNEELFERYHLLFMDPTYGTGSEAALEEKVSDYLETSLNGENERENTIYNFTIEEIALSDSKNILQDNMKQLKDQIVEYEKTAGVIEKIAGLTEKMKEDITDVDAAVTETEHNAKELDIEGETSGTENEAEEEQEVEDPRETLQSALKFGILEFVMPGNNISKTAFDVSNGPSAKYKEMQEEEKDAGFQDITVFKNLLKSSDNQSEYGSLQEHAALVDYVVTHFSNGVNQKEDSRAKCEVEYILKGKNNDYDNLQAVVNEIVWTRMPVNYAYLLTDREKKSQALSLAVAICTVTKTEALIEVVKYLLLGCWAYGESLYEVSQLLSGEKISVMKTSQNWYTDLKSLQATGAKKENSGGIGYEEYLMLLLAKKVDKDLVYARMLDVMEYNLQEKNPDFQICNCVGELTIQGKITTNELFIKGKEPEAYTYYFEETVSYEE